MGDDMPNLNFNKEEVFDSIQKDGLCTIENFLDTDEVSSLKDELLNTFDQMQTGEEFTFPNEKEFSYPFGKICRIDGAILTKLDGTAKGGVVFPLYDQLKIPWHISC